MLTIHRRISIVVRDDDAASVSHVRKCPWPNVLEVENTLECRFAPEGEKQSSGSWSNRDRRSCVLPPVWIVVERVGASATLLPPMLLPYGSVSSSFLLLLMILWSTGVRPLQLLILLLLRRLPRSISSSALVLNQAVGSRKSNGIKTERPDITPMAQKVT